GHCEEGHREEGHREEGHREEDRCEEGHREEDRGEEGHREEGRCEEDHREKGHCEEGDREEGHCKEGHCEEERREARRKQGQQPPQREHVIRALSCRQRRHEKFRSGSTSADGWTASRTCRRYTTTDAVRFHRTVTQGANADGATRHFPGRRLERRFR